MKYQCLKFLSKANIKGNKNSGAITILTCLLVIAITIISCFSVVTVKAVNEYKEDYKARALELDPWLKPLTDSAISAISNVNHVQSVDDVTGLRGTCAFDILNIDDDFNELNEQFKSQNCFVYACGLVGNEKKNVIAGDNLDDSPVFSCIVPSLFYPFEDEDNIYYENLDYIDGTSLIGKTITIKGYSDSIEFSYNYSNVDGNGNIDASLPSPEFKLNVVGTYYCSPTASGYFADIYVSRETDLLMTKMTMEAAGINLASNDSDLAKWWNTPSLHTYFVVVDDYNSLSNVFNEISSMGYDIANSPSQLIKDSIVLMANLFSTVGVFLILAIGILTIVILVQSSISSIKERKGAIGLMKAIGYKNRQIFACLCYERLYLTIKAFLIGGALSALFVTLTNYIFSHKSYQDMLYIIDWNLFLTYLGISLAIAIIVPLLCQIISLKMLVKIQPREAMSAN